MEDLRGETDIPSLRKRRAVRKGKVQRVRKYLDGARIESLQVINISDIELQLELVKTQSAQYEAFQDRILELVSGDVDSSKLEEEERESDTQAAIYQKLKVELQDLKAYRNFYQASTTVLDGAESLEGESSLISEAAQKDLSQFVTSASQLRTHFRSLPGEVPDELQNLLKKVNVYKQQLCKQSEKEMSKARFSSHAPAPFGDIKSPSGIRNKLPDMSLPKFYGDKLKWVPFWDEFRRIIERQPDLTEEDKLAYLQMCIKTPDAEGEFSSFGFEPGDYDSIVKRFHNLYHDPRLIFEENLKELIVGKLMDEADAGNWARTLRRVSNTLDKSGQGDLPHICSALSEFRMTGTLKDKWVAETEDEQTVPALDKMLAFLEKTARSYIKLAENKSRSKPKSTTTSSHPTTSKPVHAQAIHHVQTNSASASQNCQLCNIDRHPLYQCSNFQSMTPVMRMATAKKLNMCLNCLGYGHSIKTCKSWRSCRECGQRHHSSLHKADDNPFDTPSESSTTVASTMNLPETSAVPVKAIVSSPEGSSGILQTCVVTVEINGMKQQARAFLDSGSQMSFISTNLVKKLRAKPFDVHIPTIGAARSSGHVIKHCVDIQIHPRHPSLCPPFQQCAAVVQHVAVDMPSSVLKDVRQLPMLKGLNLADPYFFAPGRVDLLLGSEVIGAMDIPGLRISKNRDYRAYNTVFGWVVKGQNRAKSQETVVCSYVDTSSDPTCGYIKQFWEVEEGASPESPFSRDEEQAMQQFDESVTRETDGRFVVKLPRKDSAPVLGTSRNQAIKRFISNERALQAKGQWPAFSDVVEEYGKLNHAEPVPEDDLRKPEATTFYLPMHGVVKQASTTTKLRVVFDASARSTSGVSLNDILLPGPNLYPLLVDILVAFRSHRVGMSADISKMFREVVLHPNDRDLHRFLWRDSSGKLRDWRMTRLTFGVTSSPFLATQVLRKLAEVYAEEFPEACETIRRHFYVDDCLSGADSVAEAVKLRVDLNTVHSKGKMVLRKWRSSSQELNLTIPEELLEEETEQTIESPSQLHKALGVHWDTRRDELHISTPSLEQQRPATKRQVSSDLARTYDVMGWFSPAMVVAKILLQQLWTQGLSWDETVPPDVKEQWLQWTSELHLLTSHPVPRYYFQKEKQLRSIQLHGFADASQLAYGAVLYLRGFYTDATTSVCMVLAKTKVAPTKTLTIPRLELCGTLLLSKLLDEVREKLSISLQKVFAWSDSTIVLCWLKQEPGRLKTFVANRVTKIVERVPATHWSHVTTDSNPADAASRGLMPRELVSNDLWWNGPPWLLLSPEQWPIRPDSVERSDLPELKNVIVSTVQQSIISPDHIDKFSNWKMLVRVTAWMQRFVYNSRKKDPNERLLDPQLRTKEVQQSEVFLIKSEQELQFPVEIEALKQSTEISSRSKLASRRPFLDPQGLLRVGGRLENSSLSANTQHPVILPSKSKVTRLITRGLHEEHLHVGPSGLLGILTIRFYVSGARKIVRDVTRNCIRCRRAQAKNAQQMMGQLPSSRTTSGAVFNQVGTDYAGPIFIKLGRVRKPVIVKGFICLFVCMSTKAVHLEAVSDLTSDAFLAALHRFVSRRGLPTIIHSDNGRNYVGAERDMDEAYEMLQSSTTQEHIQHFLSNHHVQWSHTPSKAPHFGGLWEANVKSVKSLLKKTVGASKLTFEELATTLARIEAVLNSRPLVPLDSQPPDGSLVLTPGHFLVGKPLCALPTKLDTHPQRYLRRWNLCQHLTRQFWEVWRQQYLVTLNRFTKWFRPKRNLAIGDVVMVKDQELFTNSWPLARIVAVHPGPDSLVRAATVQMNGKEYRRPIHGLCLLLSDQEQASCPGRMDAPQPSRELSTDSN